MKTLHTIFLIFIAASLSLAQNSAIPRKQGEPNKAILEFSAKGLSPFTAFLVADVKKKQREPGYNVNTDSLLIQKYGLLTINNRLYANSFILSDESELTKLSRFGYLPGGKSGRIATGLVPIDKIFEISNSGIVQYIQIGEPAKPLMDAARASTWVDWIHQGYQLPQAYNGSGVVVGIIDTGFDYTHPNFFDGTGSNNYRVKRVWEQSATTGTPPVGYNFGRELTTQSAIINAQKDNSDGSHGTHVAGIAAGGGGGASSTYLGVASHSDLVLVSTTMSTVDILQGIEYIMNYSTSVNKPCVINMSIGGHIGPHDGSSIFDTYCDTLTGPGRILVGAAGNEGSDALYIGKTFTISDTVMYSFVQFSNSTNPVNGETGIDIWGNPGQNFYVAVNIFNSNTNAFEDWTPYISANSNNVYTFSLTDNDTFFPDNSSVEISTSLNPLNNKYNVQVSIDHTDQDDNYRWAMIEIVGFNTQTKMWAASGGASFTSSGYNAPIINGSTNSTVGEIGGTGNSIISVGAYTSKNTWTSLAGSAQTIPSFAPNGQIAPFSSKGPTADNRVKPDITAPGNILAASVNRFDSNYTSTSTRTVSGITNGTDNWYFGVMEGTSMATPMVTGILALWLQAYPHLTHAQALTLLKDNAWTDAHTGTIPTNGSNTWGWGKIDAHEGLKDLLTKIPAQPVVNPNAISFCQGNSAILNGPNGFADYQWSNNATTQNITVTTAGNYSVRVANNQGFISPWSLPATVTVNQNPATPLISVSGNQLTSSSALGNQWYFNGTLIQGATQQTYTATQTGNYSVSVTNSSNCSSTASPVAVTITGIADAGSNKTISIYPNPSNGLLNIQFTGQESQADITIFDLSGRLVNRQTLKNIDTNNFASFSLDGLTNGIYNLRIDSENQTTHFKLVLTK